MMRRKDQSLISMDANGEFLYHGLNAHMGRKYRADTPLDRSFVPYLIMLLCGTVDAACFISLFQLISYDSPFLLACQVLGFLFAFDVVPLYLGIQFRRVRQGISPDRFIMWLALAVCVMACALNIVLRLMTMDQMAPDLSSAATSFVGTTAAEPQEVQAAGTDSSALGLALVGIVIPFLTSLGSFFISYLTYDPLLTRKRLEEEMLAEKRDELRRFDAILAEYDADPDFAEHLVQDDQEKYEGMKRTQRALVVSYADYVRQRLKEYLGNPTAISALSEETCLVLLERLDREVAALYRTDAPAEADAGAEEETETAAPSAAAA